MALAGLGQISPIIQMKKPRLKDVLRSLSKFVTQLGSIG